MRTRVPTLAHVTEAGSGKREDMGSGRSVPTGDTALREEHTTASAKIAVLVPAHNEGRVIDRSLARAVEAAGRENIYLVADGCEDETVRAASYWIGRDHIHETPRSGKGPALLEAIERFGLLDRYDGIFMSDADSLIMPGSIEAFSKALQPGVAAVLGHIRVIGEQNHLIGSWRRYQYFWAYNLVTRAAAVYRGCFQNTPGCSSVFSTAVLRHIEPDHHNMAEDMDFCFQIHRKGLGRITWAPDAWVETCDPLTFGDYSRQMLRWGRGWAGNVIKHRIGLGFQPVDLLAGYLTLALLANWVRILLLVIFGTIYLVTGAYSSVLGVVLMSFGIDLGLIFLVSILAACRRRMSLLRHLPWFPLFLFLDLGIYGYAFLTYQRGRAAMWTSPIREKGGDL